VHNRHTLLAAKPAYPIALPSLLHDLLQLPGLLRDLPVIGRLFNSGSPMSRRRTERIRSTLLDNIRSKIQWPRQCFIVLDFPVEVSPVEYVEELLEKAGFATPDDALAHRTDLPVGMHYCHAKKLTEKEKREKSPQTDDEFLRDALILGLCGPNFYSPDRTVIWTEARLIRAVGLYQPTGFYED
jgi:hypothetical protein